MEKIIKTVKFAKIYALLLAAIILTTSCNGQDKPASDEIKAPGMDIQTAIITDNIEVLKQHIDFGTDLNAKEPMGGSTPLITATVFGKTEMAEMLINAGAELSIQNNDGSTALHSAAFFCRSEIVKLLLEKGADKSIKNNYGQTPYDTVSGSFTEVEQIYLGIGAMLEPMGLKLDLETIEMTRPQIAILLNGE